MSKLKVICKGCGKVIRSREKQVQWITRDDALIIEDISFHFKCFIDWRDESIKNRAMKVYNDSMNKVLPRFYNDLKKSIPNLNEEETKVLFVGNS